MELTSFHGAPVHLILIIASRSARRFGDRMLGGTACDHQRSDLRPFDKVDDPYDRGRLTFAKRSDE
jgi:hypothetical protein